MRRLLVLILVVWGANSQAGEAQGPKSPAESLACIQVRPGFTVELMAAEPLVTSPIAFAWGADAKLWVVEMGDYPLGVDGKGKPGGRVKFLEKTKGGNGPYDKATIFLDGLGFPTGVTPWGKGVLVTCAPDIFYAEDTDGDGKADKKEVLFTGFGEGNQQHRVNGLVWGLDNWLYGANGDSGGKVKSIKTGKVVDIRGRDFRLKPDTGAFETVTGQTQFGRARDDWGNWFGNNNSNPMYHFVLDDHYLRRNPFLLPPDPRVQVSVNPGASVVYPISKPQPRFNNPESVNHFTSACSAIVYRDDLFGPAFAGNSFVSEPVHNLIHREVMTPKGVTFTSRRADDEQKSEFLASRDNWFRPTTLATGPDGALWVADMYRFVIEHPEWIPKDWQKKLDLRAGHDKGRIYRIFPKDKTPRAIPRLDKMSIKQLSDHLESPSGWVRDTAQQLIIARKLPDDIRSIRPFLYTLVLKSPNPLARIHAICTLDGMGHFTTGLAKEAIEDEHASVRRQAVRCCEDVGDLDFGRLAPRFAPLVNDPDPMARMQAAYSLGTWATRESGQFLVRFLCQNADDPYLRAAGLSSVTKHNAKWVFAALGEQDKVPLVIASPLLVLAEKLGDWSGMANGLLKQHLATRGATESIQLLRTVELLNALESSKPLLRKLLARNDKDVSDFTSRLKVIHGAAQRIAADSKASSAERSNAIRLLGRGIGNDREDYKILASLLSARTPDDIQETVIQSLSKGADPFAGRILLKGWKGYSPSLRTRTLDVLLSRLAWTRQLGDALEKNEVPPAEIDTPRRQSLLQHNDPEVRQVASKAFAASTSPNRGKVVDEYILTLPGKAVRQRGAALFAKTCAACHKLGEIGQSVGPDLASVRDKSVQGLLVAILDPNRAVEARYVNYLATTKDGRTLTGMIASETGTSITLVGTDGKAHALLRSEIDEMTSTGKSLMPEGLEKELPPQAMADLLAFVRESVPAAKRKEFPGNQPETVRAGADGALRLTAKAAAIFGPTLVLEKQYANLGSWSSTDDHAVWTVDLPKARRFAVWIDYACDDANAGNAFSIIAPGREMTAKVAGTGSWDTYRRVEVGTLTLPAGMHELTFRALGPIRGALIDLKEIVLVPVK